MRGDQPDRRAHGHQFRRDGDRDRPPTPHDLRDDHQHRGSEVQRHHHGQRPDVQGGDVAHEIQYLEDAEPQEQAGRVAQIAPRIGAAHRREGQQGHRTTGRDRRRREPLGAHPRDSRAGGAPQAGRHDQQGQAATGALHDSRKVTTGRITAVNAANTTAAVRALGTDGSRVAIPV
jgi:hypothetical protein